MNELLVRMIGMNLEEKETDRESREEMLNVETFKADINVI
jgi:hypothetical protein